jgi:hypothetical protein
MHMRSRFFQWLAIILSEHVLVMVNLLYSQFETIQFFQYLQSAHAFQNFWFFFMLCWQLLWSFVSLSSVVWLLLAEWCVTFKFFVRISDVWLNQQIGSEGLIFFLRISNKTIHLFTTIFVYWKNLEKNLLPNSGLPNRPTRKIALTHVNQPAFKHWTSAPYEMCENK